MATAQDVIDRVRHLINDGSSSFVGGQRWSDQELLNWISHAQWRIVGLVPESNPITDAFMVTGDVPRQTLSPALAHRLVRVETNGVIQYGPTAPVLSGSVGGTDNTLTWTAATPGLYPLSGYRLYNADTLALLTDVVAPVAFVDMDKIPGTYRYYVEAYDTVGNSAVSNTVTLVVAQAWAARTAPAADWRAVCWSPELGMFCAVANDDYASSGVRVMTSTDGHTWAPRTNTTQDGWVAVCWSSELSLFVAAGIFSTNRIMTSPDGINWTVRTTPNSNAYWGIAWSPTLGIFVTVGNSGTGNRAMSSTNGTAWISRSTPANNNWLGVCWSPERAMFVAVGAGSSNNSVMTSTNGTTWTIRTTPNDNQWRRVCWSAERGLFVAVAASGTSRVMTSPDGINWTARTAAAAREWDDVCWAPSLSKFVAVSVGGEADPVVMTSADGFIWVAGGVGAPTGKRWDTTCYSPELEMFCALASGSTGATDIVMTSTAG